MEPIRRLLYEMRINVSRLQIRPVTVCNWQLPRKLLSVRFTAIFSTTSWFSKEKIPNQEDQKAQSGSPSSRFKRRDIKEEEKFTKMWWTSTFKQRNWLFCKQCGAVAKAIRLCIFYPDELAKFVNKCFKGWLQAMQIFSWDTFWKAQRGDFISCQNKKPCVIEL